MRSPTDLINMFVQCWARVSRNTETLHRVHEWNVGLGDVDGICVVDMTKLGVRTKKEHFRLVWVKCEAIPQESSGYRSGTLFAVVQFSHHITLVECNIKLSVISILVKLNSKRCVDIDERSNVKCERKRSNYISLKYSKNYTTPASSVFYRLFYQLCSVRKVTFNPSQCFACYTKLS